MTPERWQKIDQLFHGALAYEPARRSDFLSTHCPDDESLRLEVESLLSSHEQAESFIEMPAADVAAELLGVHEPAFEPGRQIGNYRIVRQLGAGGMGEVYLADDLTLNRKIALKILPPHFTVNPDRVRRFEREARAASALNHPNIVTIYEIGQSGSAHFIATEFVEGQTLRQLMNEKQFTLRETLNVSIQLAQALTGAHARGIVHRDIKPENIMVRPDGYVKILDFGLAKLTEVQTPESDLEIPTLLQSNPGLVMGTVQYMSPEQARGKKVDARTDIWSLGIVLYELLTGRVPFSGETPSHVMVSLMEDELPPLTAHANVPQALDRFVTKALRKNQKERYQNAGQLTDDLRNLKRELQLQAHSEGTLAAVPSSKHETANSVGQKGNPANALAISPVDTGVVRMTWTADHLVSEIKRRKILAIIALVLLAGSSALIPWFFSNPQDSDQEIDSIAVMPFINETGNADVEYLSDGMTETLIADLAQIPKMKVTASNSTFKYKGKEIDPREAGRSLGVEAILTGRIMQRGAGFLISVELINARDATHIWGAQYNRKESDLLSAEAEISRQISQTLRVHLAPVDQQQIVKRETVNPQAYELLLRGRSYRAKGGTENFKKAIEYFEQAIAIDGSYALAYVELSVSLAGLVTYNLMDPQEGTPRAEAAARKALELDDNLAEAHLAMASVKQGAWDWPGAEREYRRALELNPNLSRAHVGYTYYLVIHRRDEEALAQAKRARELDPLSPGANQVVVFGLLLTRQFDQAIEGARKVVELDEHNPDVHVVLGMALRANERYGEAIGAFKEGVRLGDDSPDTQVLLAQSYAKRGDTEKSRAILKQLENGKRYISSMGLATLYASLRDYEKALVLLERGYAARDKDLIWLNVEQGFDPIRTDPRFEDLLRRIGLK